MLAGIELVAVALLAGSAERFAVSARPEIAIDSLQGDIEVRAGPPGEVRVEADTDGGFSAAAFAVPEGVHIEAGCLAGSGRAFRSCGRGRARLVVRVPPDARVSVQAIRADVHLVGLRGAIAVDDVAGQVIVEESAAAAPVSLARALGRWLSRALAVLRIFS
jgi:hypothetical protein